MSIPIAIEPTASGRKKPGLIAALFAVMCALWLASAIADCGKGALIPESANYLLHYTGHSKNILQKIFDPKNTDMNYYQAREFSYFADWINYTVTFKSAALFGLHFQSPAHYLLSLGIAAIMFCASGYSWTGLLCAAIFMFSPNIFFHVGIFRTAKILAGFFFTALGALALRTVTNGMAPRRLFILSFISGLLMSVSDMQGYALLMLLLAVSGTYMVLAKDKRLAPFFAGLVSSLLCRVVYDKLMADTLVSYFGGYPLDRNCISIALIPALLAPGNLLTGFELWLGTLGYFAGGIPPCILLAIAAPVYFAWRLKSAGGETERRLALFGLLLTIAWFCLIPMNAIMYASDPALPVVPVLYYWIPATTLLYILLQQACAAVSSKKGRLVMYGLLTALLALNIRMLCAMNGGFTRLPGEQANAGLFDCVANHGKTAEQLPPVYADICQRYVEEVKLPGAK